MHLLDLFGLTITNAFIVLMLFIFWSWNLPDDAFLKRLVNRLSRPIVWIGLAHNWRMFAPTPVSGNQRVHFELLLSDGSLEEIADLPFFGPPGGPFPACNNRHLRIQHSLLAPGPSAIKPSFCKYVLAQRAPDPQARSILEVRVVSVRHAATPPGGAAVALVQRSIVYHYRPAATPPAAAVAASAHGVVSVSATASGRA